LNFDPSMTKLTHHPPKAPSEARNERNGSAFEGIYCPQIQTGSSPLSSLLWYILIAMLWSAVSRNLAIVARASMLIIPERSNTVNRAYRYIALVCSPWRLPARLMLFDPQGRATAILWVVLGEPWRSDDGCSQSQSCGMGRLWQPRLSLDSSRNHRSYRCSTPGTVADLSHPNDAGTAFLA
jgi:hypothetical protein